MPDHQIARLPATRRTHFGYAFLISLLLLALGLESHAQVADPQTVLAAVIRLDTQIPDNARTAETLGTERSGSGIVISDDGLVLTVGYLILEAGSVTLTLGSGESVAADVIGYDQNSGLGLVKANRPLPIEPMQMGSAANLAANTPVLAISYGGPSGVRPTTVVAQRSYAGYWEYLLDDAIFTAPPHPEFSGAALVDPHGNLIGIGSLVLSDVTDEDSDTRIPGNLFIPIDHLQPIIDDLLKHGRNITTVHPWIGLYAEVVHQYLFIRQVAADGPAARAGLSAGNLIVSVGGMPVSDLSSFYQAIWAHGPVGVDVPITILRDGQLVEIQISSSDRYEWLRLKPSV